MKRTVHILIVLTLFLFAGLLVSSIPLNPNYVQAVHCDPAPAGTDTDDDCWTDTDETTLGSNANDVNSTPEYSNGINPVYTTRCTDGTDNDLDGLVDLSDSNCANNSVIVEFDSDIVTSGLQQCTSVAFGNQFNVDIIARNVTGLTGFSFDLAYSPTETSIQNIDVNQLLASQGATVTNNSDPTPDIDGSYLVSVTSDAAGATAPNGTGTLARLTLNAESFGTSNHVISNLVLNSLSGNITVDYLRNGTVKIDTPCLSTDLDSDTITDNEDKCISVPNLGGTNLDDDSLGDVCDPDNDGDGLIDGNPTGAIPFPDPGINDADFDNDGLIDGCCDNQGSVDGEDLDLDGVVDLTESNNQVGDSDGDGLKDGTEAGLDIPQTGFTDITDPDWVPDSDPATTTNPADPDTDKDGIIDGCVVACIPIVSSNQNLLAKIFNKIVKDAVAAVLPGEDLNNNGKREITQETDPNLTDSDIQSLANPVPAPDGIDDGLDNCPIINNIGQVNTDKALQQSDTIAPIFVGDDQGDICDSDDDNDGFTDSLEAYLTTNPTQPCGTGWPLNFIDTGISANKIDITDLTSYLAPIRYFGTNVGTNPGDVRWDLRPGKGIFLTDINLQDLATVIVKGAPMFGDTLRAYGRTCPI